MTIQLEGLDILDLAIQTEVRGEAFYRRAAQMTANAEAVELFTYLADQESAHKKAFEELARDASLGDFSGPDWDELREYIAATVDRSFFQNTGAIRSIPASTSLPEMIARAISFEKETLLFFFELRDLVRPADRGTLDDIVAEEKRHIRRLAALLADR